MKIKLVLLLLCFCTITATAQNECGFQETYDRMMQTDPEFRKNQLIAKNRAASSDPIYEVVTIPVVVHVVYHTEEENISREQILSQIEVMNEDFRLLNNNIDTFWSDVIANPEIEFCLAKKDPNGDPHCGITRTYTDSTIFLFKESVKDESTGGISPWEQDYLNFWVCDMYGLRGHATAPGGVDSLDGIAVDYEFVGRGEEFNLPYPSYALGKTATHEVGHFLRLKHIWGDGGCNIDDEIADTPSAPRANYGCADSIACHPDSLRMKQNYMDYSDDACMYLFTQQQVDLMRKAFEPLGARSALVTSNGCVDPYTTVDLTINFDGNSEETSWEFTNEEGSIVWSGGNYPVNTQTLNISTELPNGDYVFTLFDTWGDGFCCGSGNGNYEVKQSGVVILSGDGTFEYELSQPAPLYEGGYRFVGPGVEWSSPDNWDKPNIPNECYEGNIFIESNCEADSLQLNGNMIITIRNNATLTILD